MDSKRFTGFGIMAAALRAAGVEAAQAGAAAAMVAGLTRFVLISNPWGDERRWVKDLGNSRYESADGYVLSDLGDARVLEAAYAEGFRQLDWKKSSYYVANGDAGWLSPEGVIWPCRFYGHSNLATYVLGVTYQWLEENGWVHVDHAGGPQRSSYRTLGSKWDEEQQRYVALHGPTEAQLKWLKENGHDIAYHGHGEKPKPVETFEVNGYVLDKKAEEAAFARLMAAAPKR